MSGSYYEPMGGDVEMFERYGPGGYHRVQIGDTLHHRYRVVQKLGHGSFSTMWLARDAQSQSKKLVAVKVCIANSTADEMHVMSALNDSRRASSDGRAKALIPTLLDHFKIHGLNGIHPCLVTVAARASLTDVKLPGGLFQIPVARALAAQLVLALAYVHSCGFVHGDIHLGNVLLRMPPAMADMSDEHMHREYGEPTLEPVFRVDKQPVSPEVPSHAVLPIWLGKDSEEIALSEAKILLTDFGVSYSPLREARFVHHALMRTQPPESRFEPARPVSFSSDIWTLGCAVWDILGQKSLFCGDWATEDTITCEQVDALGVPPAKWWKSWEARLKWFSEDGTSIRGDDWPVQTLEDRFEESMQSSRKELGMATFDADERHAILTLMRSMLQFRPEDRITAKQVIHSAWMQKWALPEFDKMQDEVW